MVPALLSSAASIFPYEQIVPASIEIHKKPSGLFFVIISNRYGHLSARADFPGKTRCRGRFFCKPKNTARSIFCGACCAGNKLSSGIAEKSTPHKMGCAFWQRHADSFLYQKIPAISASIRASTKKKPRTRIACRVSRLGLWLQKMSAKTRGNRQNKKLNPERKLRPGSAWCEGETRGISSRFWSKLELPH